MPRDSDGGCRWDARALQLADMGSFGECAKPKPLYDNFSIFTSRSAIEPRALQLGVRVRMHACAAADGVLNSTSCLQFDHDLPWIHGQPEDSDLASRRSRYALAKVAGVDSACVPSVRDRDGEGSIGVDVGVGYRCVLEGGWDRRARERESLVGWTEVKRTSPVCDSRLSRLGRKRRRKETATTGRRFGWARIAPCFRPSLSLAHS